MIFNLVKTQPKPQFYQSFSQSEVKNIIKGLSEDKEIPFKYFYKGQMAQVWDRSVKKNKLLASSTTQSDIFLLENNFNFIEQKKAEFERLNIIDIGPGNSYPVKNFIDQINEKDWLNSYVAIDISKDILNLSQDNIKSWFPQIDFKGYILDFEAEDFRKIALDNKSNSESLRIMNILLYLGGTIGNHRERINVLKNFQKSLGNDDILMLSFSLKLPDSSLNFNYQNHISYDAYTYFIDLLNINPNDCEIIGGFNDNTESYFTSILFQHDYLLQFAIQGKIQPVLLKKGDMIQIYRYFKYPLRENLGVDIFLQEIEQAGLKANICNIDVLNLRALAICNKKNS